MATAVRWGAALLFGLILTASLGLFIFFFATTLLDAIRNFAAGTEWRLASLWVFLALYLCMSVQAWSATFQNWRHERDHGTYSFFLIFRAIFEPIISAMVAPFVALYGFLYILVFRHFHFDTQIIIARALAVSVFIWVTVFLILMFANLSPEPGKTACAWKFPKILSCVMSNYENLAGGVVGAGGTIFAAWLAWVAVQAAQNRDLNVTRFPPSAQVDIAQTPPLAAASKWGMPLVLGLMMLGALLLAIILVEMLQSMLDLLSNWIVKYLFPR